MNYKYEIIDTNFAEFLKFISIEAYCRYTGKKNGNAKGLLEMINERGAGKNRVTLLRRGIDDKHLDKHINTELPLISKYAKIPRGNWYYLHEASVTDESNPLYISNFTFL